MAVYPADPKADYVYGRSKRWKTIVSASESETEKRYQEWASGRNIFTLVYSSLSFTNALLLWDFWDARKGMFENFSFVDQDPNVVSPVTFTMRFLMDELEKPLFDFGRYRLVMPMIEEV